MDRSEPRDDAPTPTAIPLALRRPVIPPGRRELLRAALDPEAAVAFILRPGAFEHAAPLRLAPSIAARAFEAVSADAVPAPFTAQFRASTALWLVFKTLLGHIGAALAGAGVPWLPIKGGDLALTVYPSPAERPASDLDILVPAGSRHEALAALERAGFRRRGPSGPEADDYYEREAHNLGLASPQGHSVELHHRLWGMVPPAFTAEVLAHARPWPELGPTASRPHPAHELILTAVHAMHSDRPRPLTQLLDLHRLAAVAPEALPTARQATLRHGLQLPAGLALLDAATSCGDPVLHALAVDLLHHLRLPEQAVLSRMIRHGEPAIPVDAIFLATLLAARPRRRGFISLFRRLWPHPHVVSTHTPPDLPRWRRRLLATAHGLGLRR